MMYNGVYYLFSILYLGQKMSSIRLYQVVISVVLILRLLSTPPVQAQESSQIRFEQFTTEHGLVSNWIRGGIVQDRHGFLWIATEAGLNRFDGYRFKRYQYRQDDPTSLSNDSIRAIDIDANGLIWLATGGGLNKFDPTSEIFTRYQHQPNDPAGLTDNDLRSLLVDRAGMVWVGTAGGGLNKFDPAGETFTHYQHSPNRPGSLGGDRVSALFEDSTGRLWVGTHRGGLQRLDPARGTFTTYRHDPADPASLNHDTVTTIFEDATGILWVGTNDGLNGFDPTTGTFTQFNPDPANPTILSGNNIQTIVPVQDEPGWLWIGTDRGGLNKFEPATNTIIRYEHDPLVLTSLSDNNAITIFTDQSGVVWVGTRNGLNKFAPFSQQFPYYTRQPGIANTLSDDFVQTIYQDEAGIVWLGTNAGGLHRLDPETGLYSHYRHHPADPNSPLSDDIEAIEPGRPGVLWLGYSTDGLTKFEGETQTFTHYLPDTNTPNSIPAGRIQRSLYYDHANDQLWIGLDGSGVARFDPDTEIFTAYRHQPDNANSLNSDRVKQIYQDSAGWIWVGTTEPVLNKLDPETGLVTRYFYETDEPDARVTVLHQTPAGVLWVQAGGHLLKFDPATGQFFEDDETGLWAGRGIGKISIDQNGNYWLGSAAGLSRYNPQTKTISHFDKRDGFITCCRGWFLNPQTGQFFTSGEGGRGFHSFNINQLQPRTYEPPVVLTEFHLFGQPVPVGGESSLQQAIFAAASLTLASDDNLAFEFTALDYAAPETIRYQYRLDGFENNWNTVGPERRYAAYTSLPAGDYTFRVRATNSQGQWSQHEVALPLTITPPWWETLWFRAAALAGVVGFVYGGYRWRLWQIQQRNRILEQQVAERTQELEASEIRFRGLATATFEAVIIHEQGRILDANQAATRLLGYSQAELVGRHINSLITADSYRLATQHIDAGSEGPYEIEGITRAGAIIPLEVRAKIIPFQGRQVRVSAIRDLTERRQIEAHKQRLAAMEERERIGRDLHDDLGQVMGYVSVQAQTAQEFLEQGQTNKVKAALNQLIQVANEAHGNVRQYILGVRTATPPLPPQSFFEELTRYLAQLRQQYNLDVPVSWPDDALSDSPLSPEVETQLLRIIQEALTNVRKYAGVNAAHILFTLHPDEVQVIISDEGKGFDLEGKEQETAVPGFGLEIMRERAESVGGNLEVRSEVGRGTQVIARLPAILDKLPEKAAHSLRVLLVDDHPLYLEGLRALLSARGVQVIGAATDGVEAQQLARQLLPDLILMDVEMPRCNGLEATRQIKAELPDIKIVMLTVAADDETLFEALKNGAAGYLLKSLDGRQFFTLLTEVMRGETVLSPSLAARVLSAFAQPPEAGAGVEALAGPPLNPTGGFRSGSTPSAPDAPPGSSAEAEDPPVLTPRQHEVLRLVVAGASNREIAGALHVTERTVKFHVGQILERLQLRNRYELAHYARQQLVSPSKKSSSG
jgi:PAS domain S-box-containing protein